MAAVDVCKSNRLQTAQPPLMRKKRSTVLKVVTETKDLEVDYNPLLLFDKHVCGEKGLHDVSYN